MIIILITNDNGVLKNRHSESLMKYRRLRERTQQFLQEAFIIKQIALQLRIEARFIRQESETKRRKK